MPWNRAESTERTPLREGAHRSPPVAYNPLQSFEIGEEGGIGVTVHEHDGEREGRGDYMWLSSLLSKKGKYVLSVSGFVLSAVLMALSLASKLGLLGAAWSANASPFSVVDPHDAGFTYIDRPEISKPGDVFRHLQSKGSPLPTNAWCENFFLGGQGNNDPNNKVFQIPYVLDTGGPIAGVRTHASLVLGTGTSVEQTYEPENGLSLGAVERFDAQHRINGDEKNIAARLAVVLDWEVAGSADADEGDTSSSSSSSSSPKMSAPIVRGSPYTSMEYFQASPVIASQRYTSSPPVADASNPQRARTMVCGEDGVFGAPTLVENEILVSFDTSDMTWLVFLSEPTEFVCSNAKSPMPFVDLLPPGVLPAISTVPPVMFTLKSVRPMEHGMVRVAMANNCTTGQNAQYCTNNQPNDQSDYTALLRNHQDVYPTGEANIEFTFPTTSEAEEELRLNFNWHPAQMSRMRGVDSSPVSAAVETDPLKLDGTPEVELLMYATPHHQGRLTPTIGSTNAISKSGCVPTIHGKACPVTGQVWCMVEHLHRIGFNATRPVREDMLSDVRVALKTDIHFALPDNYMRGAGDTYFSGKMLAKLARILLIAEETGIHESHHHNDDPHNREGKVTRAEFDDALNRLRAGTSIWLNGEAESTLLYDASWGGIVMCGCDFNDQTQSCNNRYPNCPALTDAGSNFGAGFYNDHHFHFGYHIFAAAVVARFDSQWGRDFFQRALMLVRDIANPSTADPFFPTWRHKDWYLGFSWASGIVTIQGGPYPNGRNQESSSEAVAAYESVALFGQTFTELFSGSSDPQDKVLLDSASRIREMGRLLLATELRSAKTYWHVQKEGTPGVFRVYPEMYEPKVVGMIWSMLAQEQTWFGAEPWKSYGIQLMPITPASEQRDAPSWVREMLPLFKESCYSDPTCVEQGWSISIAACKAELGEWQDAKREVLALTPDVFESAGGNGHSLSNTLWYIATRASPTAEDFEVGNGFLNADGYGEFY